jgi:hypothetical protein
LSDVERPGAEGPEKRARQSGLGSPQEPYGPPIHDAVVSDDLQHMKAVAEAARRALYPVEFESVTPDNEAEVREALANLDAAIARLEPKSE